MTTFQIHTIDQRFHSSTEFEGARIDDAVVLGVRGALAIAAEECDGEQTSSSIEVIVKSDGQADVRRIVAVAVIDPADPRSS